MEAVQMLERFVHGGAYRPVALPAHGVSQSRKVHGLCVCNESEMFEQNPHRRARRHADDLAVDDDPTISAACYAAEDLGGAFYWRAVGGTVDHVDGGGVRRRIYVDHFDARPMRPRSIPGSPLEDSTSY